MIGQESVPRHASRAKRCGGILLCFVVPILTMLAACDGSGSGPTPNVDEFEDIAASVARPNSTPTPNGIPLIPEKHLKAECVNCHEDGVFGATPWPQGHEVFNDHMCTACHLSADGSHVGDLVVGEAPDILALHSISGCPICHAEGSGGAIRWPATHANFNEESCTACHEKESASGDVAVSAHLPPKSGGVAESGPSSEEGAGQELPAIPVGHSATGCPACHSQGVGSAPQWPHDHSGRVEGLCGECHEP